MRDRGDNTSESQSVRLVQPGESLRARKGILDRTDRLWTVLSLVGAIVASGWVARGWLGDLLGGKADASAVATDHALLVGDHDRLGRLELRVEDVHDELRGTREDLRAWAAGRPMVVLTPEPRLVPKPTPMLTPWVAP